MKTGLTAKAADVAPPEADSSSGAAGEQRVAEEDEGPDPERAEAQTGPCSKLRGKRD